MTHAAPRFFFEDWSVIYFFDDEMPGESDCECILVRLAKDATDTWMDQRIIFPIQERADVGECRLQGVLQDTSILDRAVGILFPGFEWVTYCLQEFQSPGMKWPD